VRAALLIALALAAGCKKKQDEAPPPTTPPSIPADELKRGEDACKGYVDKACACAETVPAAKDKCDKARAFPDVLQATLGVLVSKDSSPKDVQQAAMTIRATIAECIEQTAQLPALGCKL
jgi:hypothetical protein